MSYAGVDRREHQESSGRFKLSKTIDLGTLISLVALLFALWGLSNKFENRMTAVETKVDFLMRIK